MFTLVSLLLFILSFFSLALRFFFVYTFSSSPDFTETDNGSGLLFFFLLTHRRFPSTMNAALFLSVHTQTFVLFDLSLSGGEGGDISVIIMLL